MNITLGRLIALRFRATATSLVRDALFNVSTQVYVLDPTIATPTTINSPAQLNSMIQVYTTDYIQALDHARASTWLGSGWNTTDFSALVTQLKTWADNNLPEAIPGYNLKVLYDNIERLPTYSYLNSSFIEFTYNGSGTVTYNGSPNLSAVQVGQTFLDGLDERYTVVGVNNTLKTLSIVDPDTLLPPPNISTLVLLDVHGSVEATPQEDIPCVSAFFYPGNQGVLL